MTTASSADILDDFSSRDFEQIVLCRDPEAGLESVIAVHDTTLGPSLGGVRMRAYSSQADAVADAMNLAQAMTYKAALAGLPLGGGKSVINVDPRVANRDEILVAHAKYIAALGGRYIPGVDMGTSVRDLELIGRHVDVVSSQRGDPSYFTARGVVRSIEVALEACDRSVDGARVAIQGLGNVGLHAARMLAGAGAQVFGADIDPQRVRGAVDEISITAVDLDEILLSDVDVVAPCAGGGVIDERVIAGLRASILVGAANNMLAHSALARDLRDRGIVHVPDFVANAGGLLAVEAEIHDREQGLERRVDAIADTARDILSRAASTDTDSVSVALAMAIEIVEGQRKYRPYFAAAR
ncbi:Glu/Leu/Phe/Val family dehydrogenase [Gordonia polyisoprenivorans]|uniref:Glu/Leu/Phe/Val family dehydrogenase n=1 Tax=Gordonia polyisoprenivorans TaxID=84595 RepID=UPI000B99E813|nr:Glu/Leu/Phe/Val dehydrogenase dimerization domain-containing protein [Gordonia polyisoprenivorans]OZC32472.1 amino acid dehydrogenase [Gordonia polyisoprenivorans]UZF55879.1 Glu/Leu/Phe/Val dehydrogenase [Gordonia polyisoprenivorans]